MRIGIDLWSFLFYTLRSNLLQLWILNLGLLQLIILLLITNFSQRVWLYMNIFTFWTYIKILSNWTPVSYTYYRFHIAYSTKHIWMNFLILNWGKIIILMLQPWSLQILLFAEFLNFLLQHNFNKFIVLFSWATAFFAYLVFFI